MKFYVKTHLSENISETPEGFLLCRNVPLTHTGVLHYIHPEHPFGEEVGEVVMRREPQELFSPSTMASFEGKSITIQHPDEFINPENYKELTNGTMLNVRKSSSKIDVEGEMVEVLMADFLIMAEEAITMVKNGEREVSLGYECFWELISKNEGRHSKIIGNHCALVPQGRAGKYCAINDHKRGMTMELKEKFKKLFGKSIDEAVKEKEDEEAKKAKESKDEEVKKVSDLEAKVKDLESKLAEKEESKDEDEKEDDKKEESKDEEGSVEERLAKLESMIASLLKKLEGKSEDEDEESEVIVADEEDEDEESAEGYEGEDEDSDEDKKKVGDSLSRAEILAPGIEKSKDIKKKALAIAYKTADGKKVIDSLTGGKDLSKLTKEAEEAIFNAASEMLKTKRVNDFASQRVTTIDSFPALKGSGAKTVEDINKMNAEHYNSKK